VPLDFNELRQLLVTIAQTDIAELTLKSNDFELTVRKAVGATNLQLPPGIETSPSSLVGLGLTPNPPQEPQAPINKLDLPTTSVDTSALGLKAQATSPTPLEQKLFEVTSPMVGTFYRAPAPSEPSFVEVSDRIRVGQTVCIIEAMKLMNEIEAEVSGQVIEILVQNGEPVEYGQPLMRIKLD